MLLKSISHQERNNLYSSCLFATLKTISTWSSVLNPTSSSLVKTFDWQIQTFINKGWWLCFFSWSTSYIQLRNSTQPKSGKTYTVMIVYETTSTFLVTLQNIFFSKIFFNDVYPCLMSYHHPCDLPPFFSICNNMPGCLRDKTENLYDHQK